MQVNPPKVGDGDEHATSTPHDLDPYQSEVLHAQMGCGEMAAALNASQASEQWTELALQRQVEDFRGSAPEGKSSQRRDRTRHELEAR